MGDVGGPPQHTAAWESEFNHLLLTSVVSYQSKFNEAPSVLCHLSKSTTLLMFGAVFLLFACSNVELLPVSTALSLKATPRGFGWQSYFLNTCYMRLWVLFLFWHELSVNSRK